MGLDWNFFRVTPEQYSRLLSDPTLETLALIHKERSADGLDYFHSPSDDGEAAPPFEDVYHLGLRTDNDELDTLMTYEEDDGPTINWPLGGGGVKLPSLGEVAYLLNPKEVRALAPNMKLLRDEYLEQRYHQVVEELADESDSLEERYPEFQECFGDLTSFVQTAAKNGEAILWDLS